MFEDTYSYFIYLLLPIAFRISWTYYGLKIDIKT